MRALRMSLISACLVALLGVSGAAAAGSDEGQGPEAGVPEVSTDAEQAWAAIRGGVFPTGQDGWTERGQDLSWELFLVAEPANEDNEYDREIRTVRATVLRGLAREYLTLLEEVGSHDCYAEAYDAAREAAVLLERGTDDIIREGGRVPDATYDELSYAVPDLMWEYWRWRDAVACAPVGVIEALNQEPVTRVTGSRTSPSEYDWADGMEGAGAGGEVEEQSYLDLHLTDGTKVEGFEWSDPRLPSAVISRANERALIEGGSGYMGLGEFARVAVATLRLDGEHGSWTGTAYEFLAGGDDRDSSAHGIWWLTGHGGYEGQSAVLATTIDDCDAYSLGCMTVDGVIFAGPLPPLPDPVDLPAVATEDQATQAPASTPEAEAEEDLLEAEAEEAVLEAEAWEALFEAEGNGAQADVGSSDSVIRLGDEEFAVYWAECSIGEEERPDGSLMTHYAYVESTEEDELVIIELRRTQYEDGTAEDSISVDLIDEMVILTASGPEGLIEFGDASVSVQDVEVSGGSDPVTLTVGFDC